jgi:hypothetical protein
MSVLFNHAIGCEWFEQGRNAGGKPSACQGGISGISAAIVGPPCPGWA